MAYQTAGNVLVALLAEATTGVAATVTQAQQLRITDSPGLQLNRAPIQSQERRSDLTTSMGRAGGKTVEGSFNGEITAGGATDVLFEAIMRSTWATSVAIAAASVTSITVGTNEVVAGGGDWIGDQGIRVGDVFRLTGYSTASSNDVNARVIALTAGTITVATNTFATAGATDTTCTLTRLRKLITATTPVRRSFTVEQYDTDIDISELFLGCRLTGLSISGQPNQPATVQYTFLGMDRTALATGTSPYFTSPTLTTNLMLVADDSSITYNGADVADFTGFTLDFTINAAAQPVIGSFVGVDIFDNEMQVACTVSGLRQDFSNLTLYDAETEFELGILLQEQETAPKSCLSIHLPRVKIQQLTAPVGGGDGAKIETRTIMVGPKEAATGYDGTIAVISSSEAP
jgi:hypothetical protein